MRILESAEKNFKLAILIVLNDVKENKPLLCEKSKKSQH